MVTAELNAEEIFRPNILAKQLHENKIHHELISLTGISKISCPITMKLKVWIADKVNNTNTFDNRYPLRLSRKYFSRFKILRSLKISSALTMRPTKRATTILI